MILTSLLLSKMYRISFTVNKVMWSKWIHRMLSINKLILIRNLQLYISILFLIFIQSI